MKVILFGVQKGGAAKTTSAACTAYILNRLGHKTLFIDGDSQCNGSLLFGLDPSMSSNNLVDIVYTKTRGRAYDLHDSIQHTPDGDVIMGDASSEGHSDALSKFIELGSSDLQYRIFEDIRHLNEYEYIIIDTAPAKSELLAELLSITDYVVYPVANAQCLDGIETVSNIAADANKHVEHEIKTAGLLFTIAHPQEKSFQDLYEKTTNFLKDKDIQSDIFKTVIRRRADFNNEIAKKHMPIKTAASSDASKDYVSFVRELLRKIGD